MHIITEKTCLIPYRNKFHFSFRLRQIKKKWLDIPTISVKCRLSNLIPSPDFSKTMVGERLQHLLENVPVIAKIKV